MAEGEITKVLYLLLSLLPSRLRRATFLVRGRLYFHIIVNLITADNRHISVNYYGGSKPPPYRMKMNLCVSQSLRVAYGNPPSHLPVRSVLLH